MKKSKDFSDYLKNLPAPQQKLIKQLRQIIKKAAPQAKEKMAWGMPTFTLEGNLVHIAGFKNHVSLFPGPQAILKFHEELSKFETSKGTIQFPLDKKIPISLVTRITKFQVKRHLKKREEKEKSKTRKMIRK